MGGSLSAGELSKIGPIVAWSPDVVRKAQRAVCERAVDAAEARELLTMLGISEVVK